MGHIPFDVRVQRKPFFEISEKKGCVPIFVSEQGVLCPVVRFVSCSWPNPAAWFTLSVQGPMARTVQDVALILPEMSGKDGDHQFY
jgi:hypothetical protein